MLKYLVVRYTRNTFCVSLQTVLTSIAIVSLPPPPLHAYVHMHCIHKQVCAACWLTCHYPDVRWTVLLWLMLGWLRAEQLTLMALSKCSCTVLSFLWSCSLRHNFSSVWDKNSLHVAALVVFCVVSCVSCQSMCQKQHTHRRHTVSVVSPTCSVYSGHHMCLCRSKGVRFLWQHVTRRWSVLST